jgi:transcription-repair coupling factor (superfamily II helicase)
MFIIGLIKQQPRIYQMVGANKLKFKIETNNNQARFTLITNMLKELADR